MSTKKQSAGRVTIIINYVSAATTLRDLHGLLTVAWLLFVIPVLLIPSWKTSISLLIFISIYANVAGHFSAWQAARAEIKTEPADASP
jgi:hypothetical protein